MVTPDFINNRKDENEWNCFILFQYYKKNNDIIYDLIVTEIESLPATSNINFYLFKIAEDKTVSMYETVVAGENLKLKQVGNNKEVNDFFNPPFKSATQLWGDFFSLGTKGSNKRTFISVHSHGAGFGFTPRTIDIPLTKPSNKFNPFSFLKRKSDEARRVEEWQLLKALFSNNIYSLDGFARAQKNKFNFTNANINIIPVSVFNEVIKKSLLIGSVEKIDFICLANCFMQCIETGYILKDTAKHLVASEGTHISSGINYPRLYNDMSNKSASNEIIAANICKYIDERFDNKVVRTYFDNLKESAAGDINNVRTYFAVSVNDLSNYGEIKTVLSDLSDTILKAIKKNDRILAELVRIRLYKKNVDNVIIAKCYDVYYDNPIGIIDLGNYLYEMVLSEELSLPDSVKISIFKLLDLIRHKTVAASHFPGGAYYRESPIGICPSGLSVFFPRTSKENRKNKLSQFFFKNFYENPEPFTEFLKDNKWRDFIITFYNSPEILKNRFAHKLRRIFPFFEE